MALVFIMGVSVFVLRNASTLGLVALEAAILKYPTFGTLYNYFIRRESYYHQDTRLMYSAVVDGIVKKLVEQVTAAGGVKLLSQYEYAPMLGEQYKPSTRELHSDTPPAS